MFKKLTAIILSVLCLFLCSCKADKPSDSNQSNQSSDIYTEIRDRLPKDMALSDKTVEFIGRFKKSGDMYDFGWSGSTIRAGFIGTSIGIKLDILSINSTDGDKDYFKYSVDGGEYKTLIISDAVQTYTLAENLTDSYHYVEIIKLTEGHCSSSTFFGFDYKDGVAAPAPANKERRIEFIGDSITAGYGNMGSPETKKFFLSEEDATNTYGYLTAKQLNAEVTIVGMSGAGIVQDSGGGAPSAPVYWDTYSSKHQSDKYDFSSPAPDVVVVNLGTNDYGIKPEVFAPAYKTFIKNVRAKYPNAFILCTIGSMASMHYNTIAETVSELNSEGDSNISSYEILVSVAEPYMCGANYHPSALCHKEMANEIAYVIKTYLDW